MHVLPPRRTDPLTILPRANTSDLPTFIRSLLPESRTGSAQPASGGIGSPERPLPGVVRARLAEAFPTAVDLEAFVVDYFPMVYPQLISNMPRSQQENLLLSSPERLPLVAALVDAELRRQGRRPADGPSSSVQQRATPHVESLAFLSNVPAAPARHASQQPRRHHQQSAGGARKSAWSARLRLDRIEQYLRDDIRCEVVTVPMFQDQSRACFGVTWAKRDDRGQHCSPRPPSMRRSERPGSRWPADA